jgi:lysyl oxidase-like protein 2/3/4
MFEYPCFTHFHQPFYGKHPSDIPANAIVISLAHLPGECAHPTLLFYLHGPCGAKVVASVEGLEPHSKIYNHLIDDFARPYYSLLPNFSRDDSSTQPISWFCSAWQQDRFAGNGSYSNVQVGMKDAYGDVEALQSGCRFGEEQGIWLIGEHTAPPAIMGTTTGAYVSGERGARRIREKWDL